VAVAALSIRNLGATVNRRVQNSAGMFATLLEQFGTLGGVDLNWPERDEPARAADFST
jgi:hypothetical protein